MAKKEPKVKVGDRFGKLTVVKKVDMPIKTKRQDKGGNIYEESTGKTKVGWFCKCDCGETITLSENTLLTKRSSLRSCDKCPPVKDLSYVPKKMSYEDNQEWEDLYEYIRKNIYGYTEGQLLPKHMTTRLLGLSRGKYMANNKSANNANYSYKVILNTFKFCYLNIQKALRANNFRDEQHKTNYILKIIENNINDVYVRMKHAEKVEKENALIEASRTTEYVDTFKKSEKKVNKRLEELW